MKRTTAAALMMALVGLTGACAESDDPLPITQPASTIPKATTTTAAAPAEGPTGKVISYGDDKLVTIPGGSYEITAKIYAGGAIQFTSIGDTPNAYEMLVVDLEPAEKTSYIEVEGGDYVIKFPRRGGEVRWQPIR